MRELYISMRVRKHVTFERGLEILEGALAIGRQADALALEAVKTRMDSVQGQAATTTSVPDTHLFAKIKDWFGLTKQTEPVG